MANDADVVLSISADNKKLKDVLHDTTGAIEHESKKWDDAGQTSSDNIGSAFSGMLRGLVSGFAAAKIGDMILEWGKAAIQAASDLEEVQNVVDVTFGDGAAKIESWAKTAGAQFGLTETQAKRFTSTLGAMMKSAGLAGPEIVNMSTDLAGLAADMASFYNLDFDTAFEKIRSGIAGESEPLRQLGINMSVANLEAYALSQGITKAFSDMSQGEQTMLRYQYLMQATADAQGDFARTSDGYANSVRLLQTNIETLKTNIGSVFLDQVNGVVGAINAMFEALNPDNHQDAIDKFNAIDLQTQAKLDDLNKVTETANMLVDILDDLGASAAPGAIGTIADGANKLKYGTAQNWSSLLGTLTDIDGLQNLFGTNSNSASRNITALANALDTASVDGDRASAWATLLNAFTDNAEGLSALTGLSVEDTLEWLDGLAATANTLDPNSAQGWDTLFTALVDGLPGLSDSEQGRQFLQGMGLLGTETDTVTARLEALGIKTDGMTDKQRVWLAVCKQLVDTIPALSNIINTETGEIKGGTEALREYIDEWEKSQTVDIMLGAYSQKEQAIQEEMQRLVDMQVDIQMTQAKLDKARKEFEDLGGGARLDELRTQSVGLNGMPVPGFENTASGQEYARLFELSNTIVALGTQLNQLTQTYNEDTAALNESLDVLSAARRQMLEELGVTEDMIDANGHLVDSFDNIMTSIEGVESLLAELDEYYQAVRDDTARTVENVVGGFGKITTPAEKARGEINDLKEQITDTNGEEIDIKISGLEDEIPTAQNMIAGLQDQLAYLNDYQRALAEARAAGVSDDILATLADGSVESYDYLVALGNASEDEVKQINESWREVSDAREALVDDLTAQKLRVDDTWAGMVDTVGKAVEELNLETEAFSVSSNTMDGLISGIDSRLGDLESRINTVNGLFGSLGGIGIAPVTRFTGAEGARHYAHSGTSLFSVDGSHATGLDYVPFDGYLSMLHEGEAILTAEEARVWRNFQYGQAASANNIDYDALGGVMRENARGNVYLDGRTVGRVISANQANDYRALERSGWQG